MNEEPIQLGSAGGQPTDFAEGQPPLPELESTQTIVDSTAVKAPNIRTRERSAMEVFFAWEKRRIFFNTFAMLAMGFVPRLFFNAREFFTVANILIALVFANILYCVGPVGENYWCCLGIPRGIARVIMYFALMILFIVLMILPYVFLWSQTQVVVHNGELAIKPN